MNLVMINLFLTVFTLIMTSCGDIESKSEEIHFEAKKLDSLFELHGSNIAILSCLRCECFVDVYNHLYRFKGYIPKNYVLLTDTNCNKLTFPVKHINSREQESISEEFYNLTLLKKRHQKTIVKILNLKDSKKMIQITDEFF